MNMTKKPSLAAAMNAASGKNALPSIAATNISVPLSDNNSTAAQLLPPSRVGKKIISGHFDPAVTRQLKQIALDQEATVQSLLAEALNDLFAKHGKQRIA